MAQQAAHAPTPARPAHFSVRIVKGHFVIISSSSDPHGVANPS
jgi:hypothetical protein